MNTGKDFDYAVIFNIKDVLDDFIGCIASALDERSDMAILVESQNGIDRIAEISDIDRNRLSEPCLQIHEGVAEKYGIDTEATENLLNVAEIIKASFAGNGAHISVVDAINIATAITENYNISHK